MPVVWHPKLQRGMVGGGSFEQRCEKEMDTAKSYIFALHLVKIQKKLLLKMKYLKLLSSKHYVATRAAQLICEMQWSLPSFRNIYLLCLLYKKGGETFPFSL